MPGLKEVSIATDKAAISAEGYAEFLEEVAETSKPLPKLMESFEEEVKELDTSLEDAKATLIQWNFQLEKLVPVTQQASDEMDWLNDRDSTRWTEVPIGDFLEGLGVISDQTGLKIHDMTESFDGSEVARKLERSGQRIFSPRSASLLTRRRRIHGRHPVSLASQGFGKLFKQRRKRISEEDRRRLGSHAGGSLEWDFTGPDGAATRGRFDNLVSTFGPLIMKATFSKLAGKVWGKPQASVRWA